MLDAAERALADGRVEDGLARLLEVWRETRSPALAELIELVALRMAAAALPEVPDTGRDEQRSSTYPWSIHPWRTLPAPDARATIPIVLSANHVFALASEHDPRWPADIEAPLIAHGDPRALTLLARMCAGRFADQRAKLARAIPAPRTRGLDEGAVRRMKEAVREAPARLREALGRTGSPRARSQLVALGLTHWLPDLAWHVLAPVFDDHGAFTGCTLPLVPEAIRAVTGSAEWRGVRDLHLHGDRFSASERHPWLAPQLVHRGGEVQRALVALMSNPDVAPRRVTGVSTDLVRALVAAGVRVAWTDVCAWYDDALLDALRSLDPPVSALSLWPVDRAVLASPAVLDALWTMRIGAGLRDLSVDVALDRWDAWLAPGALPEHVQRLVLRPGGRTFAAVATRDGPGWVVALDLYEHWDNWDSEFEDPPTPVADLIDLLARLDPGALAGLVVDSLAEVEDEPGRQRLIEAARRQRNLTRLVVPSLDGSDDEGETPRRPEPS